MDFTLSVSGTGLRNEHIEHGLDHQIYWHDLRITTGDVSLATAFGLSKTFGVDALFTYRLNRQRIYFRDLDGAPYVPDPPDVHHTDRTLVGVADPWLMAHWGNTWGVWSLGARLGAALPLGSTVPDPFALGEQGLPHEHIQFGAGTVEPVATLGVAHTFDGWALSARGFTRQGVWTNLYGFRAGDVYLASLFGSSKLGTATWSFEGGGTVYRENAETWGGEVQYEGNLGRTDVYAEGHANFVVSRGLALGAELRLPLYTHATGAQLDVPLTFRFSATHGFMWRTP